MARISKAVGKPKVEPPKYTCVCCGVEKKEDQFFKSSWTQMWQMTGKRVLFCKECIDTFFKEVSNRYGEKTALKICCALLDVPFYSATNQSIIENNSVFGVGMYLRILNNRQFQHQTFANSLVSGELSKSEDETKEEIEAKWSKADKTNMNYAISVVGYDPFDNCGMTNSDRKYCFNILAGYCDSDGIREDGHKIQSVVQITQSQLQCRKIDEFINTELLNTHPDENRIKSLTATKKQLLDSIAKIAQDNNLASAYNSNSKQGKNTLSEKTKEMIADDFKAIEVNVFDINTSNAMKQIANLSNQSILEQLSFDGNDYSEMLKEQREMLVQLQEENEFIEEENRNLKNKLSELESKKRR